MESKKNKRLYFFLLLVLLLFAANHFFGIGTWFFEQMDQEVLKEQLENNKAAAILLYMVLTVVGSVVLALPGVSFAILAGALFGPVLGTICCSAAATLGAMLAFVCGRYFLKDSIRPLALKNKYLKKWLFDESGKNQLFVLMITRLVPLFPYNLQNFAYGVTDIRFATYALGSFVFMLPGTAMYTVGTAGLFDAEKRILYLCTAALLAFGVSILGIVLKKRYFSEAEADANAAEDKMQTAQKTNTGFIESSSMTENVKQEKAGICSPTLKQLEAKAKKQCIHCGKCRRSCVFLQKYGLDLGDTEKLNELAYHCFLCGRCTEVCPKGIDGRRLLLAMREEKVQHSPQQKLREKGYGLLCWEKQNYKFQNYRNLQGTSVLFPGCNFPSVYPKTTKLLMKLLRDKAGIGTVFDCCRKPVAELGMKEAAEEGIRQIDEKLRKAGVQEVIMLCPNCYAFLNDKLSMPVVSIYQKLAELGLGQTVKGKIKFFLPCPDRKERVLLQQICKFLEESPIVYEDAQCCGFGGCAGVQEPQLAAGMRKQMANEVLCTYCASCSCALQRGGNQNASHILLQILNSSEAPDAKHSLLNRMGTTFWWY